LAVPSTTLRGVCFRLRIEEVKMSRSRMFRDDDPMQAKCVSPRTTIVGGRPPEDSAELPPVPTGIQKLLRLASVDDAFRRELLRRRAGIAAVAGVELTASEQAILAATTAEQLEQMIRWLPPPPASRRTFLRQTASTAVMLLGGAVLAECAGCSKDQGARTPSGGDADAGASPPDAALRPDVDLGQLGGGAAPDMPPLRPVELPTAGGARPDWVGPTDEEPVPVRPEYDPMTAEGGIAPHMPEPPDAGAPDMDETTVPRPAVNPTTTRGGVDPSMSDAHDGTVQSGISRPTHNPMAPGGVRPDEPAPLRPDSRETATTGGAAPDWPQKK
jgi:hypothetical protein